MISQHDPLGALSARIRTALEVCNFIAGAAEAIEGPGGERVDGLRERMADVVAPVRPAGDWLRRADQLMSKSGPLPPDFASELESAEARAFDALAKLKTLIGEVKAPAFVDSDGIESSEDGSIPDHGALAQLGALRDRLAVADPAFDAAARVEREAEAFCAKVRADLKADRLASGLSQKDLADRIEVGQSAISKIESGRGDLSLKTVFRIARAMGLRPVLGFAPAHSAAEAPRRLPDPAAVALAGAVQEDLIRKIPEIVQEAAARVAAAD
ncbi:helix-turn-helix protein [Roseiarcus fermentans]|uniref:Helix-turn-helix protein n=1 Tax=Roseiarcus fermentans TaxID=1473586 RepID=A0A366EIH9_9HYPH|nr:helix-turn-helix transcriptional regulator [Roseiarcus fermentans]RBP01259.1 helix-turn-helix protein [Roseiarcus fermentans]